MNLTPANPFAPLAEETLRAIAATGVVRNYPKNTILINEGDSSDSLYIVLSGRVKVYASNEAGREFVLSFFGPGEYVGEMSLDGSPRSASVALSWRPLRRSSARGRSPTARASPSPAPSPWWFTDSPPAWR